MTRDLGRRGSGRAGRWAGGIVACLWLATATSASAFQQRVPPATTTAVPTAAAPKTYAECLRSYVGRTSATAYCQRLFPTAAPAATTPSATVPPATTPTPTNPPPTREPLDTSQLDKLIEAWRNRPKTPPGTATPPADPLAIIPEIQAACAAYAGVPERWRRCTADAWRKAGLRGDLPLALRTPPVIAPPPPVVRPPPPVQPPVVSKPPVQAPPILTPRPVEPEPVLSTPVVEPELPPAAVVEPPPPPKPPPVAVGPSPPPEAAPSIPIWLWLVALVAAMGGGFGLARLLGRARPPSSRPPTVEAAPCTPDIVLVADPGVVVLTPDGPPRAGMAVSLRIERDADGGAVRLDYPTLETAP